MIWGESQFSFEEKKNVFWRVFCYVRSYIAYNGFDTDTKYICLLCVVYIMWNIFRKQEMFPETSSIYPFFQCDLISFGGFIVFCVCTAAL